MRVSSKQLALALLAASAATATQGLQQELDFEEEVEDNLFEDDEVVDGDGMVARELGDYVPTPEPTSPFMPTDDYYATTSPYPTMEYTYTFHPTDSPYPTKSPYPTPDYPDYTPYPTMHEYYSPQPTTTWYPTDSPYPTKSPYPTYPSDGCMGKPITVKVDLDGTYLIFCCIDGMGDFDIHSAFHFSHCSLAPPDFTPPPVPTPDPTVYYPPPVHKPTPDPTVYYPPPVAKPTPKPSDYHYPPDETPSHEVVIKLALKTDNFPDQTSFTLQDAVTGEYIWDYDWHGEQWDPNFPYFYEAHVDPMGCYYFIIEDSYGDGLASWHGSFELFFDNYLTWYGSMFGKYSSVAVGGGCYYIH